ncbi:hypothetical protein I302_105000 [Kwoniella bestiolae CBS 10118]|uniref:Zn(2)-C6 fungal-type domain-containing protein n=1 Tax=Kwoniella bestiolae CBS 10118 TaxID=1296100 RepID=A0A1B9FR68_9TREE|nr:hypothetical protein I302_08928 [Kwoniella bestiolae CBS 10118]OCF21256.1 hypothetical protein I302_08928 [Kwoniella bestiolae CBS 10118]
MAKTADNLPHPRPPIRPTLTGQRHSFHTSEVVRPAHPPRQAFQTFPPNRSRPSSPRPSAQEHMSRKHERSFPHLSETSLGQALSPRRTQYRRTASDDIPTSYIGSHEQRQYPQEMQRSATHPQPLHRVSRSIPQHYDEVASRAGTYAPGGSQYQSATSQVDAPQAEAWITPGRTPARVTSGWTANDLARYHDGYSDAMSAVMSGVGVIGRDTSFRINIHDPRKSAYQHAAPPSHPLSTTEVPPPQPPPQVYQPPARYRNENLRIDPSLQRPGTHRRPSQSSSNIPTPTVTTPLHKIHPPPASDYFGTAFHYSHPCATEHPPAKRPKRQSISCYPCRQRKLKCDGKKPCAQCSRRHIDGQCSYAERIRRRGRGKKATDEEQGLGDSEEHDYEGEDVPQAESSIMAQRRVGGVRSHDEERDEGDGDLSMDSALDSGSRPPGGLGSPVRYPSRGSKEEGEGEEEREKEY